MTQTNATAEVIIEPDRPIIDAHHHLTYGGKRYLLDEYLADAGVGHDIRASVYIESRAMCRASGPEALKPVGETEFANGVAAMAASGAFGPCRVCAAIVGYADLGLGAAVGAVLDAHLAAGGGRFRGIRQGVYWDADDSYAQFVSQKPPPGLLADGGFQAGFAELGRRGLSFDAVLFHRQIPELTALARRFPDIPIILNHLGFPLGIGSYAGRRSEVFTGWRSALADLAACENVLVKIGGFGIPLWGFDFHLRPQRAGSEELAEAWRPYMEVALASFGPSRAMFESNFPPDGRSADYAAVWNAFKRLTTGLSDDEKASLFYGTALATYRPLLD